MLESLINHLFELMDEALEYNLALTTSCMILNYTKDVGRELDIYLISPLESPLLVWSAADYHTHVTGKVKQGIRPNCKFALPIIERELLVLKNEILTSKAKREKEDEIRSEEAREKEVRILEYYRRLYG